MDLRARLRSLLSYTGVITKPEIAAVYVIDNPDRETLAPGTLYVVGDKQFQKWAVLRCPCGCGDAIMLSLSKTRRPSWSVEVDWLGRPTLDPSIRQTAGCYSHFWLRRGKLDWCGDTGPPWRRR